MVTDSGGSGRETSPDRSDTKQPSRPEQVREQVADFVGELVGMAASDASIHNGRPVENGVDAERPEDRDQQENFGCAGRGMRALGDVPGGELEQRSVRGGGVRGSPTPSSLVAEYWSGSETVVSVGEADGGVIPNGTNGGQLMNGINGVRATGEERDPDAQRNRQGENGSVITDSFSVKDGSEMSEGSKSIPFHDIEPEIGDKESEIKISCERNEQASNGKLEDLAVPTSNRVPVHEVGKPNRNNNMKESDSNRADDTQDARTAQMESEISRGASVVASADAVVRSAIDQATELYDSFSSENGSSVGGSQALWSKPPEASATGGPNSAPGDNPGPNKAAVQKEFYDMMKRMVPEPQQESTNVGVPFGDFHARISGRILWSQTIDSVSVALCVPASTNPRGVKVKFSPDWLFASISGQGDPLVDEKLYKTISVDECVWSLEKKSGSCVLTFELEKKQASWWSKLFESDDPAKYQVSSSTMPPLISPSTAEAPEAPESADTISSKAPERAAASASSKPADPRLKGLLSEVDMTDVISTLRRTVESNGPGAGESASKLAELYYQGIGVEKNYAEAVSLYKYALIKSGVQDDHAACQLGRMYNMGGHGIAKEPEEALRWWRIASSMGNVVATHNVGVLYLHGEGCEADPVQAETYFRKARTLDAKLKQKLAERRREKTETEDHVVDIRDAQEKARMREAGIQTMKYTLYGTCAVIGIGLTAAAIMHWWRNRL